MADSNTYESRKKIEKWTTKAKFDALDKSDIPIGTEYNVVGDIEEGDMSASVQEKLNAATKLYYHRITFLIDSSHNGTFGFYSSSGTAYTSIASLPTFYLIGFSKISGKYGVVQYDHFNPEPILYMNGVTFDDNAGSLNYTDTTLVQPASMTDTVTEI